MSGGIGNGFIKGALFSLIGVSAVSLMFPVAPPDPGKTSQVDLTVPSGSGFNAGGTDVAPVLPGADKSVIKEGLKQPVPETAPTPPLADTDPSRQPTSQSGVDLPSIENDAGNLEVVTSGGDADGARVVPPPALGLPMPDIDAPVRDIPSNNLPQVDPPATDVTEPAVIADADPQSGEGITPDAPLKTVGPVTDIKPEVDNTSMGAFLRNRTVFDNPTGKPLVSIILVDAGAEGLDQADLLTFSFPVTFALDPTGNGAAERAQIYARSGFEVLAMAPSGGQALEAAENDADIETALSGIFATLPQAVGLIDQTDAKLQKSSKLAKQVIASFEKSGHGLLTYDIGLNSTDQKAQQAGLYADTVFRVLDGKGESAAVIKRLLDRAVLEAGKNGRVIVLGRTYPETVTALFSWALSAKSATITLAPVSAALLAK